MIYEPTQVNGQIHLRCSARQMGREYSKSSGRAGIIRSARLMCLSGPRRMILRVVGWVVVPRRPSIFPLFGNNSPLFESLFWLMFICSVGLKGFKGKAK